jgi:hypothetical protein
MGKDQSARLIIMPAIGVGGQMQGKGSGFEVQGLGKRVPWPCNIEPVHLLNPEPPTLTTPHPIKSDALQNNQPTEKINALTPGYYYSAGMEIECVFV